MLANRRRSPPEVVKEILTAGPATWSNIRFTVGLNHNQAQRYLPYLVTEGYLENRPMDDWRVVFHLTDKGKMLLALLNELSELLESPGVEGKQRPSEELMEVMTRQLAK